MRQISLNGKWQLYYFEQGLFTIKHPDELETLEIASVPCTVPGNVELDLADAGLLPKDLYRGDNILEVQKYEDYEWWYVTEFLSPDISENERVVLNFGGVDCLAKYFLNREEIGQSSNMFVDISFNITGKLKKGSNTLAVNLRSATTEAFNKDYPAYLTQNTWSHNCESAYIRKAPHCYGWDIMPRAVSAGLWKDVDIIIRDGYDIKNVFYSVKSADSKYASVRYTFELEIDRAAIKKGAEIEVKGKCGASFFSKREKLYFKAGDIDVAIHNPVLWWPKGYGEAGLYHTVVRLYVDGKAVSERELNTGIRTVELIRTNTTDGVEGTFRFRVNHTDIMCHGTNWVPLDAFHSREKGRYKKALELLDDIGCNIVRCWGGNVYPDECLYDFCDRKGIMIWQDFAMACSPYPQDDEFYREIEKEAAFIIQKYRNHPSLVLWAGDNECDELLSYQGTSPETNYITRKILPRMVELHDTGRPYLPSSPYFAPEIYEKHRFDMCPEDHLWGPRDYFKSDFYTKSKAHFMSEIGYHGCPSIKSLEKTVDKEFLWPYQNNRQWNLHSTNQKNEDGRVMLMARQIKQLFGNIPDDISDFVFASQVSQAEANKFFIENVRCNKPVKTGIIWWNLIDGWPQMSDAVVDYFYEKKIAYDYIKRSQTPFCIIMSEISNWHIKTTAVNDTLSVINGSFTVTDADTKETVLKGDFSADKNSKAVLGEIPVMYSDKKLFIIRWNIDSKSYSNHYICGLPPFSLEQYKKWYSEIVHL